MAIRKELKNIASGIYGSFISRNNDVAGYWGIGKLSLLAQQSGVQTVRIDLLGQSMAPPSPQFSKLVSGYGLILKQHLSARNIPESLLASAIIELDFKPESPPAKYIPIVTWGNLFRLTVALADDRGKNHVISGYSYCGPHNPNKESRSAGGERF